jgi:hypothetical protein
MYPRVSTGEEKIPISGFSLDLALVVAHNVCRVHLMRQLLTLSSPVIKAGDLTSRFPL